MTSKIWGFEFELRPSKVNSGQNYFCCSKVHIIISYSIFDFNVLRVWPLTSKSHLGLKKLCHSKAHRLPISLFYGHHLSILYRFRVIRLQNFQGFTSTFDVWKSSGIEKIILFEGPYMTSYLTSMDTICLSRTVFDKFDFKVFRVWPWPLTPKGHLESKKFIQFESPYMTSYLTFIDNISLSRTVYEIFDFKVFRVWLWPLTPKGHLGSKNVYHSKAYIWLPIWLLWTPSLYLVPFLR